VIAVDTGGADAGVAVVVEGARRAGGPVTLFGPAADMPDPPGEVVDAPVVVSGEEEPAHAVRAKRDASIVQAARAVGEGRAEGLVSAGATGAALAASLFYVKRLRGVHRPAIAVMLPVPGHPTLLLDAGANVEVRPEHLVEFSLMGAAFMRAVHGVERPRVGLLSVGDEAAKGTPPVVEAHARLASLEGGGLEHDLTGNIEGHEVTAGVVDVVVTDGFTGNVALKLMEGTARTVTGAVRDAIRSSPLASLGGLLVRGRLGGLRRELDPNATGGAILLGLRRPVVIAHGGSSTEGIANAVRLARRSVEERAVERTAEALASAGLLRSGGTASVGP
jgi:glycerol-3-phosphate acyltransferase PlsX